MRNTIFILLGFILFSCFESNESQSVGADYIFKNGKVYTVNDSLDWAEAVAVKGDSIVFVGSDKAVMQWLSDSTEVIDLKGKMMLPGFIQSHVHLTFGAAFAQGVWLADLETEEEFVEKLSTYLKENRQLGNIRGFGWKKFAFDSKGPNKSILDALDSLRPIELFDITGKSSWVNSKALDSAGLNSGSQGLALEGFHFDANGELTGLIDGVDGAFKVSNAIDSFNIDYLSVGLDTWIPAFSRAGITTLFDPSFVTIKDQFKSLKILANLDKENRLPFRIVGSYKIDPEHKDFIEKISSENAKYSSLKAYANVLKIEVDGSVREVLGNMKPFLSQADLNDLVLEGFKNELNIHFHANAASSVKMVLTALELAREQFPNKDIRTSLAHTFLVDPADIPKFKSVGLVASFAGNWFGPDYFNNQILQPKRSKAKLAYNINSFHKAGVRVTLGSDWPFSASMSTMKILPQIEMVHTRQVLGRAKGSILNPMDQRLELVAAIQAATINGAYQLQLEDQIGSIEVGKKADLVVINKNIFEIEPNAIHKLKVEMTMSYGEIVYE